MTSLPAWITAAWMGGVWLGDRLAPDAALLGAAALVVMAIGPLIARGAATRVALALMVTALAGASGLSARLESAAAFAERTAGFALAEDREITLDGTPCGSAPVGSGIVLCDAVVVSEATHGDQPHARRGRFLVAAAPNGPEAAALARVAGAPRVRLRVRTKPLPEARNPGARDRRRALTRRGIGARGYLVDPALVTIVGARHAGGGTSRAQIVDAWGRARARVAERLAGAGSGGSLLAALAVGDRSRLDQTERSAFARLGIAHLLAVSGLHVALVAGFGYAMARRLLTRPLSRIGVADPRLAGAGAAMLTAVGYAAVAGMGVPLQRALVVAGVLMAAFVSGRSGSLGSVLAVAAGVVLAIDPASLFEAGPQLSFAAAGALMMAARLGLGVLPAGAGERPRLLEFALGSVRTSSIALASTAPILAAHGMGISPLGLVANVLAVPLTGVLLLPSALVAASIAALAPDEAGRVVLEVLATPAGLALAVAKGLAERLPVEAIAAPVGAWGVAGAVGVAVAAARMRGDVGRVLVVVAVGLWLRSGVPPPLGPAPPRIVAFDVGQGDAILVEGRRGALLVDGGRAMPGRFDLGDRVVIPGLAALGVTRLDVVVASHADLDHRGGLAAVLRRIPVDRLWLPPGGAVDPAFEALRAEARRSGVPVEEVAADGRTRRVGDLAVDIVWPPVGVAEESTNDRSIVARIEVDRDAVLLTGDVGRSVEQRLVASGLDLSARILKVAHHGSATSSDTRFLERVGAEVAVVSAGCGARSGLPTPQVLERLRALDVRITWTGREGAIAAALGGERRGASIHGFGQTRAHCERQRLRSGPVACVAPSATCE